MAIWCGCFITFSCANLRNGMERANEQNISTQETIRKASQSGCICKNAPPLAMFNSYPLHMAAYTGCMDCIQKILKDSPEINSRDNVKNSTALHIAATYGQTNVAELLIDSGANIEAKDEDGYTALHLAAIYGQYDIAKLLLEKGANKNNQDKLWNTALHWAVKHGRYNIVKLLLNHNARVDIRNKAEGDSVLHWAAKYDKENYDKENITQLLLNKIIQIEQIDIQNKEGNTALHLATMRSMANLVKLLLDSGARIDMQNKKGNTALHLAAMHGIENLVELLLNSGAKIDMQNKERMMPLDCAVKYKYANVVKLLLDRGNKINKENKWGAAALHWASKQSDLDGIKLLLNAGVKVDAQNEDRNTALHTAYIEYCKSLHREPFENRRRQDNLQLDTVKLLEHYNARKDIKNKKGYSPEDYAYLVFIANCYETDLTRSACSHNPMYVEKRMLGYLLQNNKFKQRNIPTNQHFDGVPLKISRDEVWDIFKFLTTDLYLDTTGQVTQSGAQLPLVNSWTSNHGREDIIQRLRDYVENLGNIDQDQAREYEQVANRFLKVNFGLKPFSQGMYCEICYPGLPHSH
ncbi:ankyrin repeat domain-containing protein [Candidatus Cardinium hertigii]|nr:ankyrin repeat domain-containing protein [Candidatus Cardinium hertigii]